MENAITKYTYAIIQAKVLQLPTTVQLMTYNDNNAAAA